MKFRVWFTCAIALAAHSLMAATFPGDVTVNGGVLESSAGNLLFTGRVTIGSRGASFITRSSGHDMVLDGDLTGNGLLTIDNAGPGSGGTIRFTNDLSFMGTVRINGPSRGFSGGRLYLGDANALNQATLVAVAGMRGIGFGPGIKTFSLGGLGGDANIDLQGKILRVGVTGTDCVYSGAFTDSVGGGEVIKDGSGKMTLTGKENVKVSIYNGTLIINGTVPGEIKVGNPRIPLAPATLEGSGTIGNLLLQTPGAIVQPGILTVRNFSMIPGSTLSIRLGDQIRASGQFSLFGNLHLSTSNGFYTRPGHAWYLMVTTSHSPVLGRFTNLPTTELTISGHRFRINYAATQNDPAATTGNAIALIALSGT